MITEVRKITMEQWYWILVFVLSVMVSFLLGYTVFRYVQVDLCKSPVRMGDFSVYKQN
jgi:hypothetical protein